MDLRRLLEESPGALVVFPDPDSERRDRPIHIELAAWATDIAATLNAKYGRHVDLRVGAMTFPARQLWVSEYVRQLHGAPAAGHESGRAQAGAGHCRRPAIGGDRHLRQRGRSVCRPAHRGAGGVLDRTSPEPPRARLGWRSPSRRKQHTERRPAAHQDARNPAHMDRSAEPGAATKKRTDLPRTVKRGHADERAVGRRRVAARTIGRTV